METTLALVFVINLIGLIFFLYYAKRKNIVDKPNERSSHQTITIRGGGVFFTPTFAALLFCFYPEHYLAAIALVIVSAISFLDDIYTLPVRIRLPIHFLSVALLIHDLQMYLPLLIGLLLLIMITAWLNTFNFMDGINGITGLYAIVLLFSLYLTQGLELDIVILGMLLSVIVFMFFNFRKKALCFAGDVGSVSLALIIAWAFLYKWMGLESLYMLAFPALYAVDSIITIIQRLLKKENIFEAHRSHLYQILANEQKIDHRIIAMTYAFLQLFINYFALSYIAELSMFNQFIFLAILYITLGSTYLFVKKRVSL